MYSTTLPQCHTPSVATPTPSSTDVLSGKRVGPTTRRLVDTVTEYVNGFMIQPEQQKVLFIKKNRPTFQAGKWNGIGGKIEPGETIWQAMVREFREETGVQTWESDWEHTLTLQGRGFVVHFFRNFCPCTPCLPDDHR